jgi:hypothetical protein
MVDVVIVEAEMEAVVVLAVEVVKDEMTRTRNALSRKWIRIMILKKPGDKNIKSDNSSNKGGSAGLLFK